MPRDRSHGDLLCLIDLNHVCFVSLDRSTASRVLDFCQSKIFIRRRKVVHKNILL